MRAADFINYHNFVTTILSAEQGSWTITESSQNVEVRTSGMLGQTSRH
jgi:hypothetical protein